MACDCFVLAADREQRALALARFFAGEAPIFLARDGHVYPDRRKCISVCGQAVISNKTDDWKKVKILRAEGIWEIECEKCKTIVLEAAEGS